MSPGKKMCKKCGVSVGIRTHVCPCGSKFVIQKSKPTAKPHRYKTDANAKHYNVSDEKVRHSFYASKPDVLTDGFNRQVRLFRQFKDCPEDHPYPQGYSAQNSVGDLDRDSDNPYNIQTSRYEYFMWRQGLIDSNRVK